jgi:hypothetical protein
MCVEQEQCVEHGGGAGGVLIYQVMDVWGMGCVSERGCVCMVSQHEELVC